MPNKLISCVISCYNEEKNIAILLDQIKSNNLEKNFEFIIVNNGSTDNSSILIAKHPFVKLVKVKKNEGYGNGILEGLNNASGEILAWTHAD